MEVYKVGNFDKKETNGIKNEEFYRHIKISYVDTRRQCEYLDLCDNLREFRSKFKIPENVTYMMGNSLGLCPVDAIKTATRVINNEWATEGIAGWDTANWYKSPLRVGEKIGKLIGANNGETIVCDSTSINVFKLVGTSLAIQKLKSKNRRIILLEKDNFPTDLYIVQGLVHFLAAENYEIQYFNAENPLESLLNENVATVLLSHVNYRTGFLYDMKSITRAIHIVGAHAIWDLCHSIGSVLIDLNGANADFALGCTYKYLNSGPGAASFVWVNKNHHNTAWTPLTGWYSHEAPFKMSKDYLPSNSISRFLIGTPDVISISLIESSVQILLDANMTVIRKKSLQLSDLFIKLIDEKCPSLNLVTPRNHDERGSHLAYQHENSFAISKTLRKRNVFGDFRYPDIMRFAMTPLYLRFVDVWDVIDVICDVVNNAEFEEFGGDDCVT